MDIRLPENHQIMQFILNYLKVSIRNIKRHKINSSIGIFGLSIGLACCMLTYLFIQEETSFDSFHENNGSLYRLFKPYYAEDGTTVGTNNGVDPALTPAMAEYFDEIEWQSRFTQALPVVRQGDNMFSEVVHLVDEPFFTMLSFPFVFGTAEAALDDLYDIVITESMAKKYFGSENPMGKTLQVIEGAEKKDFIVSAVVKDAPANTAFQFSMVMNIQNLPWLYNDDKYLKVKRFDALTGLIKLKEGIDVKSFENRLATFASSHYSVVFETHKQRINWKSAENPFGISIVPLADAHLSTQNQGSSVKKNLRMLSIISLAILLISSFNYINLSVAMAAQRSKEVGVRKVVGASRKQLMFQFSTESSIVTLLAMGIAVLLTSLAMPEFNALNGTSLSIGQLISVQNIWVMVLFSIVVGVLAGSYPGLLMSGFKTLKVLKGNVKVGKANTLSRVLIITQFGMGILLVVLAFVAGNQLQFMTEKDRGYNNEGLLMVQRAKNPQSNILFQNELRRLPSVESIASTSLRLGVSMSSSTGGEYRLHWTNVDHNFFKLLDIDIVMGRDFNPNGSEERKNVIVNEKFMSLYGFENYEGVDIAKEFEKREGAKAPASLQNLRIIGVVKDFELQPANRILNASIFFPRETEKLFFTLVKVNPTLLSRENSQVVKDIEKAWSTVNTDEPINLVFQEDLLNSLYSYEKRWANIIKYTSILAFTITCLGLFGFSLIMVNNRKKDIGIRKVLGAKVIQLIILNTKGISGLVTLANLIALPLAYYLGEQMLQTYPYRINTDISFFVLAATLSLAIAFFTVLYNVRKAAMANPAESLRDE